MLQGRQLRLDCTWKPSTSWRDKPNKAHGEDQQISVSSPTLSFKGSQKDPKRQIFIFSLFYTMNTANSRLSGLIGTKKCTDKSENIDNPKLQFIINLDVFIQFNIQYNIYVLYLL